MEEVWKPIPSIPHHEASNYGHIRSVSRRVPAKGGSTRMAPGKIKKTHPNNDGYLMVSINRRRYRVHRLVASAFFGMSDSYVLHKNDVKTDNRLSNLYYGDDSANRLDNVHNGNHNMARRTHCKNGHEYSPENTKPLWSGRGRQCITCQREKQRRYYYRKRTSP